MPCIGLFLLVGAAGFELATPCAQGRCATRLRYAPTCADLLILKHVRTERPAFHHVSSPNWAITVPRPHLTERRLSPPPSAPHSRAGDLFQSLALPLQLHLRVLLADLRVALPEHLGDPPVRNADEPSRPCSRSWTAWLTLG